MAIFSSSEEALKFFQNYLAQSGTSVAEVKTIPTTAGRGRTVYQKQIWTQTREIFHVKHWTQKWIPKDSSEVSEFAKPLDEKLKYAIRQFGRGDLSASGLNEGTMLDLLAHQEEGRESFLVTTYSSGDILWCRVDEMYLFATRYGLIPQYSRTYGEPFCWIPTGWFKVLDKVVRGPGAVQS